MTLALRWQARWKRHIQNQPCLQADDYGNDETEKEDVSPTASISQTLGKLQAWK